MNSTTSLYDCSTILVRPGKPGRYAFARLGANGQVVLRRVGPAGRKFDHVYVDVDAYERSYCPARTPDVRTDDRANIMEAIDKGEPLPEHSQLKSDIRVLIRNGWLTRGDNGKLRTTHAWEQAYADIASDS